MGDALYYLVLITAAFVQVAFLTLIVLLLYKLFISKQIISKQAMGVFIWIALVNGSIGIISYLDTKEKPVTFVFFVAYFLAIVGLGLFVARITSGKEVK